MTEIYKVQYEVNDRGWNAGDICFTEAEDAVKHMRKFVAHEIMAARLEGCKVEYLCVFKDTAMESMKVVRPATQTISFRITKPNGESSHYEYRVWAAPLYDKNEYNVEKRFGYCWL